eukprot:TRINITY_DN2317_c0_g1_i1.p1 TRINITY_DN2317_c0_g1~~TRINITY_DN2317_c0_g1_i1.p1  ORF type:complete len:557 (-),score=157.76 TRINITY_DN2317_c0_g1_i1:32-1702(-)
MAAFQVETVQTKAYLDQKPGTSGLRKKVTDIQAAEHYIENFVQSIYDSISPAELTGATILVGGDGRYLNDVVIQKIIRISAANGVGKILIGEKGILSTPACSAIIRARKCLGGIVLTASHNPGGPDGDFGIKYNVSNGGPAPEWLTDKIFEKTKGITQYKIAKLPETNIGNIGVVEYGSFSVEVISSMSDYIPLLQTIFDFEKLKNLAKKPNFKVLLDSLNGVTGPYAKHIFTEVLGFPANSTQNDVPLPDFGKGHPDPNLVYAHSLVKRMFSDEGIAFGCAWDGDGDRNMVTGDNFFVTPSDSVAIIAANATVIPYYKNGLVAVSRSMPTSGALDRVAKHLGLPLYEVPTGWKFFGNLMDKYEKEGSSGFICGEESFGTGSAHIREKDGIWATLAWLSILEAKNASVADIVKDHWKQFGRNYYSRYDYESVDAGGANKAIENLRNVAKGLKKGDKLGDFEIDFADEFQYTDPVDGSVSRNQGTRFVFSDGSRFVVRLSGTGSVGATIRLYLEKYEPNPDKLSQKTEDALAAVVKVALDTLNLKTYIGTDVPTVIT